MRIAIRADGGSKIGRGHIMRTLVLAKELAKTNDVFYVSRNKEEFLGGVSKLKEEGFLVKQIDGENLINEITKIDADLLITDSYDVSEDYFKITKKYFKKTMYIDDLNNIFCDVDYILNQNIGTERWEYRCSSNCKKLLGTKYTLLRNEFRETNPIKINDKIKNVLITMGGADPLEATPRLIKMLECLPFTFHVIIGKNFKNINFYKEYGNKNEQFKFYYDPNIVEVMKNCDIAITACGSTIYELSVLGIPTLGIVVADNQEKIAEIGHEENILINLGYVDKLEKTKILDSMEALFNYENRKYMQKKQISTVDKNGVFNIIDELNIN